MCLIFIGVDLWPLDFLFEGLVTAWRYDPFATDIAIANGGVVHCLSRGLLLASSFALAIKHVIRSLYGFTLGACYLSMFAMCFNT